MKDYKIVINISDAGGVYSADTLEEAKEIADAECEEIYNKLEGRVSVSVESVECIDKYERRFLNVWEWL